MRPYHNLLLYLDGEEISKSGVGGYLIAYGICNIVSYVVSVLSERPTSGTDKKSLQVLLYERAESIVSIPLGIALIVSGVFLNNKLNDTTGLGWHLVLLPYALYCLIQAISQTVKVIAFYRMQEDSPLSTSLFSYTIQSMFYYNLGKKLDQGDFTGLEIFWWNYLLALIYLVAFVLLLTSICCKDIYDSCAIISAETANRKRERPPPPDYDPPVGQVVPRYGSTTEPYSVTVNVQPSSENTNSELPPSYEESTNKNDS